MKGPTTPTIYRMAIENYYALGYSMTDDIALNKAMDALSKGTTRVIRRERGNKARRFSEADAAEVLHALGAFLNKEENRHLSLNDILTTKFTYTGGSNHDGSQGANEGG